MLKSLDRLLVVGVHATFEGLATERHDFNRHGKNTTSVLPHQ